MSVDPWDEPHEQEGPPAPPAAPTPEVIGGEPTEEVVTAEPTAPAPAPTSGRPSQAIAPWTGEVVALTPADAPTDLLAERIAQINDTLDDVHEFRRVIVNELAARLDFEGARTARVGAFKLETNAPSTEEYDVNTLHTGLMELVAAGVLSEAAVEKAVPQPERPPAPPRKVAKAEVTKLKRHTDPRVAEAIAASSRKVPSTRTLKVHRVDS